MRATGLPPFAAARAASRSTTVTSAQICAPDFFELSAVGTAAPESGHCVQVPLARSALQLAELSIMNSTFGRSAALGGSE
jgi:hypothetical protein